MIKPLRVPLYRPRKNKGFVDVSIGIFKDYLTRSKGITILKGIEAGRSNNMIPDGFGESFTLDVVATAWR